MVEVVCLDGHLEKDSTGFVEVLCKRRRVCGIDVRGWSEGQPYGASVHTEVKGLENGMRRKELLENTAEHNMWSGDDGIIYVKGIPVGCEWHSREEGSRNLETRAVIRRSKTFGSAPRKHS